MADAMTTEDLSGIAGWVVDVMDDLGAPGAGLLIALENLFPPLPSELILPLAGFTAGQGRIGLVEVLVWTTLGSVVGALALYGLGAWLGIDRLRALVDRVPLLKVSDVDRSQAWFDRHGDKAVLLGRMVPLFRSLISIPAGVNRMGIVRFTVLTTIGSAVWNSIFVIAGYQLGSNWEQVEGWTGPLQKLVIVVVGVATLWFVARRWLQWLRGRRDADAGNARAEDPVDPVDRDGEQSDGRRTRPPAP